MKYLLILLSIIFSVTITSTVFNYSSAQDADSQSNNTSPLEDTTKTTDPLSNTNPILPASENPAPPASDTNQFLPSNDPLSQAEAQQQAEQAQAAAQAEAQRQADEAQAAAQAEAQQQADAQANNESDHSFGAQAVYASTGQSGPSGGPQPLPSPEINGQSNSGTQNQDANAQAQADAQAEAQQQAEQAQAASDPAQSGPSGGLQPLPSPEINGQSNSGTQDAQAQADADAQAKAQRLAEQAQAEAQQQQPSSGSNEQPSGSPRTWCVPISGTLTANKDFFSEIDENVTRSLDFVNPFPPDPDTSIPQDYPQQYVGIIQGTVPPTNHLLDNLSATLPDDLPGVLINVQDFQPLAGATFSHRVFFEPINITVPPDCNGSSEISFTKDADFNQTIGDINNLESVNYNLKIDWGTRESP